MENRDMEQTQLEAAEVEAHTGQAEQEKLDIIESLARTLMDFDCDHYATADACLKTDYKDLAREVLKLSEPLIREDERQRIREQGVAMHLQ